MERPRFESDRVDAPIRAMARAPSQDFLGPASLRPGGGSRTSDTGVSLRPGGMNAAARPAAPPARCRPPPLRTARPRARCGHVDAVAMPTLVAPPAHERCMRQGGVARAPRARTAADAAAAAAAAARRAGAGGGRGDRRGGGCAQGQGPGGGVLQIWGRGRDAALHQGAPVRLCGAQRALPRAEAADRAATAPRM